MSSVSKPGMQVARGPIVWSELDELIGRERVRSAEPRDGIDDVLPVRVVEPETEQEVVNVLSWANGNGVVVAPRGGGTKADWGRSPAALDLVLSMKRLDRVIEHAWADMTVSAEAGCTIAKLQGVLAQHGQRLAIDPLFSENATVGGLIATNDSGALRLRYGGVRDLIIGVTVALPDGTLAKSGGKVVKNVAGYDLQKLMTGAFGTLGVITQATFRVHPLPRAMRTLSFRCPDVAAGNRLVLQILDSILTPASVQMRFESNAGVQVDVKLEGIEAGIEAQERLLRSMSDSGVSEAEEDIWGSRERLFTDGARSLLCKFSVLPSRIAAAGLGISQLCSSTDVSWRVVAQATGLGVVRVDAADEAKLLFAANGMRAAIGSLGGTVVILGCPPEVKKAVDVWGPTGDAQPVMLRVKQQFDPRGILNRGRFVGGI